MFNSISRYFYPSQPTPQTQTNSSSQTTSKSPTLFSWAKNMAFSPIEQGGEALIAGVAEKASQLFTANQAQMTQQMKEIFTTALIGQAPDDIQQLLKHIQALLRAPTRVDLDQIIQLLPLLTKERISYFMPNIKEEGINLLLSLKGFLAASIDHNLTIRDETRQKLTDTEQLLSLLVQNQRGALIQTLDLLSQDLNDPSGITSTLRQQLNDPNHGILAESLRVLKRELNARVPLPLKEAKRKMDHCRTLLQGSPTSEEIQTALQTLHSKLAGLNGHISDPQLAEVEGLRTILQGFIDNPSSRPTAAELLTQTDRVNHLLSSTVQAQRGIIEEAADILVEGLGKGLAQIERLPNRMLNNLFSPQQQPSPPLNMSMIVTPRSTDATSAGVNGTLSTNSFLNLDALSSKGQQLLDSILNSAGGALSNQMASSLGTMLLFAFKKIRDHIQTDGHHLHLFSTLDPLIGQLDQSIKNSSWTELHTAMRAGFRFIREQQVYFQGVRLPINSLRAHSSAIPELIQTITAQQNLLQPPDRRPPPKPTEAMIDAQAQLFKTRLASSRLVWLAAEKICGMTCDQTFYAELLKANSNTPDLAPLFRSRLFDQIDQSSANFFWKWISKRTYDLLHPFAMFYTNSIADGFLKLCKKEVYAPASQSDPRQEFIIQTVRNWLAVESGAYNQVANAPASQAKDLSLMMEDAIKMPERNEGLSQEQLYNAVAKTVLNTFGPKITWDETINSYFSTEIPSHSLLHFLNPVMKGLNTFCSFSLRALTFVPQWIGNHLLQAGTKLVINQTHFLKDFSEQSIESLRRNTPASYGMHRAIFRQLQKVLDLIQKSLNEDPDSGQGILYQSTNMKRSEITSFVDYAIEVLNKSQYRTQDRLHNYLNNQAPMRDRIGNEVDDTFLPEIMERIVTASCNALNVLTSEEELQQLLYDSLTMANDAFEVTKPVSDEEFATVQKGIRDLTDQTLETLLFHAVSEKFDFTNEKQKAGISHFMQAFHNQTHSFTNSLNGVIAELNDITFLPASTLQDKISSLLSLSIQYHQQRFDALGKVDGSPVFRTETKNHFNELSNTLLTQSRPITDSLKEIKTRSDEISNKNKKIDLLLQSKSITLTLHQKISADYLSEEDIAFCKIQLALLQTHLTTLRQEQSPVDLCNAIDQDLKQLSSSLQKIEDRKKTEENLNKITSLFDALKSRKFGEIGSPPSPAFKEIEKNLLSHLNPLIHIEQKTQLQTLLTQFIRTLDTPSAENAARQFTSCLQQAINTNQSQQQAEFALLRQTNQNLQGRLDVPITTFSERITALKQEITTKITTLSTLSTTLRNWSDTQYDLPIWNLFLFDMDWVTEGVKTLAFDRGKNKIQQLFNTFYQKHNYLSFANQAIFLPFLKQFGKQYLS